MQNEGENEQSLTCRENTFSDSLKIKTFTINPRSDSECLLLSSHQVKQVIEVTSYVGVKCHIHIKATTANECISIQGDTWAVNVPVIRENPAKISFTLKKDTKMREEIEGTVELDIYYSEGKVVFDSLADAKEKSDRIAMEAMKCGSLMPRFSFGKETSQ